MATVLITITSREYSCRRLTEGAENAVPLRRVLRSSAVGITIGITIGVGVGHAGVRASS